jgi:hypothetical protein
LLFAGLQLFPLFRFRAGDPGFHYNNLDVRKSSIRITHDDTAGKNARLSSRKARARREKTATAGRVDFRPGNPLSAGTPRAESGGKSAENGRALWDKTGAAPRVQSAAGTSTTSAP